MCSFPAGILCSVLVVGSALLSITTDLSRRGPLIDLGLVDAVFVFVIHAIDLHVPHPILGMGSRNLERTGNPTQPLGLRRNYCSHRIVGNSIRACILAKVSVLHASSSVTSEGHVKWNESLIGFVSRCDSVQVRF
jgi:hypothetical protein